VSNNEGTIDLIYHCDKSAEHIIKKGDEFCPFCERDKYKGSLEYIAAGIGGPMPYWVLKAATDGLKDKK